MTTDPLRRFEAEHAHALHALDRLEAAARALESGAAPEPQLSVLREIHEFLATAVRRHNEDEERALFPLLEELAPSGLFEQEHRDLRGLEEQLRRALEGAAPADRAATAALAIVDLLRTHIAREDYILFPMARALLGSEGLALVAQRLGS